VSDGASARRAREAAGDEEAIPFDLVRFAALPPERREVLLHVSGLMDGIAYGTVVLVLQDAKVIQVETSEKIRLR